MIRIISENYLDSSFYNTISASSEQTNYEVENVLAKTFRTATWRTDGYFKVTASNKTIIFQETDGVDLTATLAEGEVTSRDAMCTAIKTALEAAGGDTYTVTRSNEKFKIASDGSFLRIDGTDASMTADDLLGFTTNQSTPAPSSGITADEVRIHSEEFILVDFGVASSPNSAIITGLVNDTLKLTTTAVVKIQMNTTNVWTSPLYDETMTLEDDYLYKFSDTVFDSTPYRYARIQIVDKDNAEGYIEVASAAIGTFLDLGSGKAQFPFQEQIIDASYVVLNSNSSYYSEERNKLYKYSLSIRGLSKANKESLEDFFYSYGVSYPFFISLDEDEVLSTDLGRFIKLVRFEGSTLSFSLTYVNHYEVSFDMIEAR